MTTPFYPYLTNFAKQLKEPCLSDHVSISFLPSITCILVRHVLTYFPRNPLASMSHNFLRPPYQQSYWSSCHMTIYKLHLADLITYSCVDTCKHSNQCGSHDQPQSHISLLFCCIINHFFIVDLITTITMFNN